MLELVLGGARSGKSAYAETLASNSGLKVVYLATATVQDNEMAVRIQRHQADRPDNWGLIEEPLMLAETLRQHANSQTCILIDCLTLWLTNLLLHPDTKLFAQQRQALLDVLPTLTGQIVMVSNEVGQGIVPENALARRFIDEAGWLHQDLARLCDKVTLISAGLPLTLKGIKND